MLKQTQKQIPYIQVFKTGSGEEFIATVVEETMLNYTITNPLCMVQVDNRLQFAPFMMMADPKRGIVVPKPIITANAAPDLEVQYESITSGIAMPKKQAIITS
jgi:hypothetical protein